VPTQHPENFHHLLSLIFLMLTGRTIRTTYRQSTLLLQSPTMEAGIADHVWSIEEIVDLLDSAKIRRT